MCQYDAQKPKTGLNGGSQWSCTHTGLKDNRESYLGLLCVLALGERLLKQNRPCPTLCSDSCCIK